MDDTIILRTNGYPFATERAAQLRANNLAKEGKTYAVIPWTVTDEEEGQVHEGFALEKTSSSRRAERIPVGTRNRLRAPRRPGYHRRFVNNEPGRIRIFEQAGYKLVTQENYDPANPGVVQVGDGGTDRPTPLGSIVQEEVGGGKQAVLMEIRQDWYDEDQALKARRIDEMESQIKNRPEKDGYYGDVSSEFDARKPRPRAPESAPRSAVDMDQGHF